MHLIRRNPGYTCSLGDEMLTISPTERDLGALVDSKLCMGQRCALGCIRMRSCSRGMYEKRRSLVQTFQSFQRAYGKNVGSCVQQQRGNMYDNDFNLERQHFAESFC